MDYFPLKKGLTLYYTQKSSEFSGSADVRLVVENVKKRGRGKLAEVRMYTTLNGHTVKILFTVNTNSRGVVSTNGIAFGGRTEYKLPIKIGLKWDEEPDTHEIVSSSETVKVPAGSFKHCLKVVTEIGGGDSGVGTRIYAPGVGLVWEKYAGEDLATTLKLVKHGIEKLPEKKKS